MAKQMVNPIERHVEKLVVGVAALVLIGAVALYLVTSPNKVEMGGQMVTPKTVDAALADRAREVLSGLGGTPAPTPVPEPLAGEFAASLAPLKGARLALVAPIGAPVPLLDPPSSTVGKVSLVEVPRPENIGATSGRSTVEIRNDAGQVIARPVNWATVSAIFEYKKQVDLQKNAYGAKWDQISLVSPEIQRRAQRADGTWSDDDWMDIAPAPALPLPKLPAIELAEARDGSVVATPSSAQELIAFLRVLEDPKYQRELLRPLMYVVANGDAWKFPILTSYGDVLKEDADYATSEDLYGLGPAQATGEKAGAPKDPHEEELAAIRALIDRARKERSRDVVVQAFNKAAELSNSTTASLSQRQRAAKLKDEANLLDQDIQRAIATGTAQRPTGDSGPAVAAQRQPIQQVWANDAAEGSLKDGHTYQYRIRCRIINALAGDAMKFDNPQDATHVLLASDWSEPTAAVTFEPSSVFFVTYDDPNKKVVGVEFFRWYYGVWLKSRRENLAVGQPLFIKHRTQAPGIKDPTVVENPEVEWSADGTIVDIDFGRQMLERKTARGSEGVSFGSPKKETAMVYMDAAGGLHERLVPMDREDPEKRAVADRLWVPKQ